MFNVDADKPSQSLQLLFQLPSVQQQGSHQQSPSTLANQQQNQQASSPTIAKPQTAVCQLAQTQISQANLNLNQHSVLSQPQNQQHCVQHSQVLNF